jgi:phosphatidylglycerophosphate synthase
MGLGCCLLAHVICMHFNPSMSDGAANMPRWAYVVVAFLLFVRDTLLVFIDHHSFYSVFDGISRSGVALAQAYQTLDNLDGRQARRTGSSSPLGLLFDHGVDALNVTLSTLARPRVSLTQLWIHSNRHVSP